MRPVIGLFVFVMLASPLQAQLHFPQPYADWGEIKRGPVLVQRFPYVNKTGNVVTITDVKTTCGCLTPKLTQKVVQPGQTGYLNVEVNTLSQPAGPNNWKTIITCQDGQKAVEVILYIEAKLKAELALEPAALNFITADNPVARVITLTDYREQPLQITSVKASEPGLQAQLLSSQRDEQGRVVHAIQIQLAKDFPEGRHEEVVSLYTNDQEYRELRVPVSVTKNSKHRMMVVPEQAVIPVQSGQGTPSKVVLLRDPDGQEVKVAQAIATHPAVQTRWISVPGGNVTLRITIDGTQVGSESFKTEVEVHLVKPTPQVLRIPVECQVTP